MGNRKQPFGYRMTLGEITILPEEAELVRFIFQGYSTGATLGELTKALCRQEIPYYAGRTWNKNMVSRILEDGRYIGEKDYPALIEPEQLRTAAEKRTARARPPQKTPAQKALRRLCGAPPSEWWRRSSPVCSTSSYAVPTVSVQRHPRWPLPAGKRGRS